MTVWTVDDLRGEARSLRTEHDPVQQRGDPYKRCALCKFTRHPCDTYWLATALLAVLEGDGFERYIAGDGQPALRQRTTIEVEP